MWQTGEQSVAYIHIQQVTVQLFIDWELCFGHLVKSNFNCFFGLLQFLRLISHKTLHYSLSLTVSTCHSVLCR